MSSATRVADITVRDLTPQDHAWARDFITRMQGSERIARLGALVDPLAMEGLVAEEDGAPIGMASVHENPERGLEVLVLLADPPGHGAGTALLDTVRQVAVANADHRLWLVTTNDNLPAIHFYLRRGLHVAAVHHDAVKADRKLKPEIPMRNAGNGLPIRDLVEFELSGDELQRPLRTASFPSVEDLDQLPVEAFVAETSPLLEGASKLLQRLAEHRPFGSDEALMRAAFEITHAMPETEQIELIDSHPRIGADASTVSAMSFREQGYAAEGGNTDGAPPLPVEGDYQDESLFSDEELAEQAADQRAREIARAYEELAILNQIYEDRFGFRYVIFVAGRPKAEIVPLLEHALRNDREAELRRAVDDAIYIAGDRLRRLRGLGTEV